MKNKLKNVLTIYPLFFLIYPWTKPCGESLFVCSISLKANCAKSVSYCHVDEVLGGEESAPYLNSVFYFWWLSQIFLSCYDQFLNYYWFSLDRLIVLKYLNYRFD